MVLIYPVWSYGILKLWWVGYQTNQCTQEQNKRTTRGLMHDMCPLCHKESYLQKRIPGDSVRGAAGHNTLPPCNRNKNSKQDYKGKASQYGDVQQTLTCLVMPSLKKCHSAIRMDPENLKESHSFRLIFSFKGFVILEDLFTNLVVRKVAPFVNMKQGIIDQFLFFVRIVCQSARQECWGTVFRENKSSRHGLQHSLNHGMQGMHGSGQGIVHK